MAIIKVRLSADTEEDLRAFAHRISAMPAVEADELSTRANYRDRGFRGYLTVVTEDLPPDGLREFVGQRRKGRARNHDER